MSAKSAIAAAIVLNFLLLVLSVGCARQSPFSGAAAKANGSAIVGISGDKQIAPAGAVLDQPLVVQVNDSKGAPVAGAPVQFRDTLGTRFQPSSGLTGADGQFTTTAILGAEAGRYRIVAATQDAAAKTVEIPIDELAISARANLGRQLSDFYCVRCHDQESSAERVSNYDNLVEKPHAFSDGAFLNRISDADLTAIVTHGGPAVGKPAEMPPYGVTLHKSDIEALVAWIRASADPPYQQKEIVYAQH